MLAGLARYAMTGTVVTIAALASGMQVDGGAVDLFGLLGLGLIVNAASTLFATGVSMRAKSMQAGPVMQIPIFLTLFLAPVYVPIDLLQGWIHSVAQLNPASALLAAGRGFISGRPDSSGLAFACALGLTALMSLWAVTGLRRAERSE